MSIRRTLLALAVSAILLPQVVAGQWVPQQSPVNTELRGLSVVSPVVVWSSGARATVVHTLDGGRTWRRDSVPASAALDFRAIAATSAQVAHAMSIADSSRIYRTTNGGRSWTLRWAATRKGTFLDAIRFWDARHGIAMSDPVDGKFLIVTTDNGGETWTEVPADRIPPALEGEGGFAASGSCLTVFGRDHVWFVTGGAKVARVFRSSDRGRTWAVHETPIRAGVPSAGIFSIAFTDARRGVVAGGDYQQPTLRGRNVAITTDGGQTWSLVDSTASPAGYRSAVAYVPGTGGRELVAVGLSGSDISRDGGWTWTPVDTVGYNSVGFATRSAGWAVGPSGRIAKWKSRR